jgi:hypothetical protein
VENIFIGEMSGNIPGFSEGKWIRFAPHSPQPEVNPGQSFKFRLTSSGLPGLVECRADGGTFVLKGVGEEMPGELEASLPSRHQAMPSGYTAGPVDKLRTLSRSERIAYLLKVLPECHKQGWITTDHLRLYQQHLNRSDLGTLATRAAQDMKAGYITSEVAAIVKALENR